MQHDAVVELLARAPMFRGLGGELLTAIWQRGGSRIFSAGQPLAVADTMADAGLLILDGHVTLIDSQGYAVEQNLEPGMFLNDMAIFVETGHFYTAVAEDEVTAFILPRDAMHQLMQQLPYLAAHFVRTITQKLTETKDSLIELDENLAQSRLENPQLDEAPITNLVASGENDDLAVGTVNGNANGIAGELASALPMQDLLANLNKSIDHPDQIPPEPGHDQTAFPSHAPRRQPSARRRTISEPASPKYDQAAGHDLNLASSAHGNSTR